LRRIGVLSAALAIAASIVCLGIVGCGGSDETNPTPLKVGVTEQGKRTSFSVPKSAKGGLVTVTLTNEGKAPHGVQFVRYTGNHTAQETLKEVGGENEEIPKWIRGQGGIGSAAGGQSAKATLNLPAGNYVLVDAASFGEGGPPATAELKVTEGDEGDLPSTSGTVTAAETGHDKFEWEISGLKAGENEVTFNSEGDDSLHLIIAVPLKGKAPPVSQIKKDLASEGPPPSYVDFEGAQSTAILDGGLSQTTTLDLKKPGQYLFFCPLTDRDGGKPHDQEGLLAVETVE
jgi:hypothetical protein